MQWCKWLQNFMWWLHRVGKHYGKVANGFRTLCNVANGCKTFCTDCNFFLKLHHRHLKADRDKSTVKLKYVGNPFYMGFKTCLSVGCPWGQCLNLPPVLLSILTYLLAKHDIPLFLWGPGSSFTKERTV